MESGDLAPVGKAFLYVGGVIFWVWMWWGGHLAWLDPVLPAWAQRGSTDAPVAEVSAPADEQGPTVTPDGCLRERQLIEAVRLNPAGYYPPPGCPAYTPAQANALIDAWTDEFLAEVPIEMRDTLRPSVRAWFLAEGQMEKSRAENELIQTALLWRAANRPQIVYHQSPWLDSDVRRLEREIGRLSSCVRLGLIC